MAGRDKPYIVLDCDDTHMDIPHLVVVMTSYHHRDEDETAVVVHFQNPQYDVPDCDDTWEGDATGTSEVGDKEVQCGDHRGKLGTSRMMKCTYHHLWMIFNMGRVVLR